MGDWYPIPASRQLLELKPEVDFPRAGELWCRFYRKAGTLISRLCCLEKCASTVLQPVEVSD